MQGSAAPTTPPPVLLGDQTVFDAALDALALRDAAFVATVLARAERPTLRRRDPGFEGLAWIVVSQQVSTASANAIFGRLKTALGRVDADAVTAAGDETLRACGLSAPKLRTLRALAAAVTSGALDFAALGRAEAEAAHAALVAIKGIGPWTADVFLLFCLGHADAWPAGDLALQEAAKLALALPHRPTTQELLMLGERWRPLRGVAAHCLWAYYRAARLRAATLDAPAGVAAPGAPSRRPAKRKP